MLEVCLNIKTWEQETEVMRMYFNCDMLGLVNGEKFCVKRNVV